MDFDPELHREFINETLDSVPGFSNGKRVSIPSSVDTLKMTGLDMLVLLPIASTRSTARDTSSRRYSRKSGSSSFCPRVG
jgi:hypothetical protein